MDTQTLHYMRKRVEDADRLSRDISEWARKRMDAEAPSAVVGSPNSAGMFYKVVPLPDAARIAVLEFIDERIRELQKKLAEL